ncbi:MAG TPA: aldo/keto reductase [Candidatus Sulfotelmatobacter sp.]|nr:aldo/keto reductase [Candidatus Sulfotelmatobacter sp.]
MAASTTENSPLAMPRRPLGKTGWMISIVGFGGGSRYLLQEDLAVAERMIHRAVELGINYFDTAYMYQTKGGARESYRRYGKFLVPNYRKQIILTSKLAARDAETAKINFEETLKELGTDHLDLLHFHDLRTKEDVDKIVAADGALKAYRQWKEQGVIKAIGVTGHANGEVLLDAIRRIEPDCVMCPQNPAHSGEFVGSDFAKVIPFALQRGMGMLAMKTTARNGLIGKNGVTAEQLVRYALNLPVAAAVIGMPSVEVVESCAAIARTLQPMEEKVRKDLEQKLAGAHRDGSIPYLASGYRDGHCECLG